MFDPKEIKKDFPIFKRKFKGKELVYLDNAASSQKPKQVIDAMTDFYGNHYANVHRGLYTLSEEASEMYDKARKKVSEFVGAARPKEVIFTSGSTESLNMVAFSWGLNNLKENDHILLTGAEHHSNLVPWQVVAQKTGAKIEAVSLPQDSNKSLSALIKEKINDRVKIVSIMHASNVTGEIINIKEVVRAAQRVGALVSVDGAQAAPHIQVNMQSLDCDFYSFSAHKMLGPTGIGALFVKEALQKELSPLKYGGGMIDVVDIERSTYAKPPEEFEAGTQNIAGVVGFAAAIDYLQNVGMLDIRKHEIELNTYVLMKLDEVPDLQVIGPKNPEKRTGLVAFTIKDTHAHDVAAILNTEGIAVRSGHHCTMPLHKQLNIPASTRASYYLYNDKEDIDKLVQGLYKAIKILK
jgi:cysteine desulfurase/selenocysteine lyase